MSEKDKPAREEAETLDATPCDCFEYTELQRKLAAAEKERDKYRESALSEMRVHEEDCRAAGVAQERLHARAVAAEKERNLAQAELAEAHREMANALRLPQSATWDELRDEAARVAGRAAGS